MDTSAPCPHLVKVPCIVGAWTAWRWSCLRAAGFPASLAQKLASPEAAGAASALLEAERESARQRDLVFAALNEKRADLDADAVKALRRARKRLAKGNLPDAPDVAAAGVDLGPLRAAMERVDAAKAELATAFAAARAPIAEAVRAVAREPRFREAVTWQNRTALETAFAPLLGAGAETTGTQTRRRQELVASYLQRYCAKNDTIGFFGPVGWARLEADGPPVTVRPGPSTLSRRSVHFEQWGIDALAKRLSADARFERWMIPRRLPFVRLDGTTAHSAMSGRKTLSASQASVLSACSGERTAEEVAEIVAAQLGEPNSSETVFTILRQLRDDQLVAWAFEVPLTWNPDDAFRALLDRITDEALRAEAAAPLEELELARRRVAESRGDPDALAAALGAVDETFTRLTGAAPTQRAGSMYAARQLVFEDCQRDLDATLGPDLLAAIGAPLSLLLASARWLTFEVARAFEGSLRSLYADLLGRSSDGVVRFADLWFRAQRLVFGGKESPLSEVTKELERKWSELLVIPPDARRVTLRSADLEARVRDAFRAPRAGWQAARFCSPDLMIAAASVDEIARGTCEIVLGELHVAANTLDSACLVAQHPAPEELSAAYTRDARRPAIMPVFSKEWLKITSRTNRALCPADHRFLETSFDVAPGPRDRVLALSDLVVEERGGDLVVRAPDGATFEIIELFAESLSLTVLNAVHVVPRSDHTPRVTIDRLVVARESWRIMPADIPFAFERDEVQRFAGARRWAEALGIPRFFFAKSALEVKPLYVDLDSPVFIDLFAKLVRRQGEHVSGAAPLALSEMLPGLDQTWVPDAEGHRYTSELRIVFVDQEG